MTFVKEHQLDVNWLLNQILGAGKTNLQITKVDDNQVFMFIKCLKDNPLKMPDGKDALQWIRERLAVRLDQAENKVTMEWEKVRQRYRFIIHQLDIVLIKLPKDRKYTPPVIESKNELSISFPN
jgi:hypothetical protein